MARALFELLPVGLSVTRALDIGSATGQVARELSIRYPTSRVVALDLSTMMLSKAKENLAKEEEESGRISSVAGDYVAGDFEELPFKEGTFDLVLSNLTYQWALDLRRAIDELCTVLAPGGLVLMNTLTYGTLGELKESFSVAEESFANNRTHRRLFMPFVESAYIKELLEDSGLILTYFDERSSIREYKDMWELLRVLKSIGAINPMPMLDASLAAGSLLKSAARIYKDRFSLKTHEGKAGLSVRATYNTVFIMAQKPE